MFRPPAASPAAPSSRGKSPSTSPFNGRATSRAAQPGPDDGAPRRPGDQHAHRLAGRQRHRPRHHRLTHRDYTGNIVALLTDVEQLHVEPDLPAKVIIDESSGSIVMGADVRVSDVAIAQGNLTIRVTETPEVAARAVRQTGPPRSSRERRSTCIRNPPTKSSPCCNPASTAAARQWAERARHRSARHDRDPSGDQSAGALQAEIEVM